MRPQSEVTEGEPNGGAPVPAGDAVDAERERLETWKAPGGA